MITGSATLSPSAKAQLTKRLDAMLGDTGTKVPGLGVVLYRNGQEVYNHFAGSRRFLTRNPTSAEPITRDTRFRIASISKQFTTAISAMRTSITVCSAQSSKR